MKNRYVISTIVGTSILLSVFINAALNKNIEKKSIQKYAVENFYNDFRLVLSSENKKKALGVVSRLYNNPEVFNKMRLRKLLKLQENALESITNDLYSNSVIRKNFDSLFNIYSTNPEFKNKFSVDVIYKKLQKNPFTIFYTQKLLKKLPNKIESNFDPRSEIKGFRSKLLDKPRKSSTKPIIIKKKR